MRTQQFRENRSAYSADELAKYRGQWIAFSMDGRRIVANASDFVELDTLLRGQGEDPERVVLEFIDVDDKFASEG
jgi:hypothetical protein